MNTGHSIKIVNASEHNLKNLTLEIPSGLLIAVTGVSGSGKSSLAVDVLAREGQRHFLETMPAYVRRLSGALPQPAVDTVEGVYPVIQVKQHRSGGSVRATVGTLSQLYDSLRLLFARGGQGDENTKLTRSLFSFNHADGACPRCQGLGQEEHIDIGRLVADESKSLRQGALVPTLPNGYIMYSQVTVDVLNQVCEAHGFTVDIPWRDLTDEQRQVILYGSDRIKVLYGKHSLESRLKWQALKAKPREEGYYKGMMPVMEDILRRDRNKNILRFATASRCSLCRGHRLRPEALAVRWRGQSIAELSSMSLTDLSAFLGSLIDLTNLEQQIIPVMQSTLNRLTELGVGYLSLNRTMPELSTGEIQRIRLTNQLAIELSNVLYVFDEVSVGLHPRHRLALTGMLRELVARGNTVCIIEHDPDMIRAADWIVELGPGGGSEGGELLYNGPLDDFKEIPDPGNMSPTWQALFSVSVSDERESSHQFVEFQHDSCQGPVRLADRGLSAISGPPGSGQDDLIKNGLLPGLDKVIVVNQSPIGRTPRSNPATYTGLAQQLRNRFAALPDAGRQALTKSHFSFNNKGGRCEACEGAGSVEVGMHYLGRIETVCPHCRGRRFNDRVLSVRIQGKSIADIYDMSILEASRFFQDDRKLHEQLSLMVSLDLGYVKLGQSSNTLSGGEAQRIRLAAALLKSSTSQLTYLLHEPCNGLHVQDVKALVRALRELTGRGHRVVVLENRRDFLRQTDWIVDMAGNSTGQGGRVVFQGRFADLLDCPDSVTAVAFKIRERTGTLAVSDRQWNETVVYGAETKNLKNINVAFRRNQITAVTGVSGSGKTALVFNTLSSEAESRFYESLTTYARGFVSSANPAIARDFKHLTPVVSIDRRMLNASSQSTVGTLTGIYEKYRYLFSRTAQAAGLDHMTASHFSFNHELGACPHCGGRGHVRKADRDKLAADWNLSVLDGAFAHNTVIKYYGQPRSQFVAVLKHLAREQDIDLSRPLNQLDSDSLNLIFDGTGDTEYTVEWHFETRTQSGTQQITAPWKGFCRYVDEELIRRQHNKNLAPLHDLMSDRMCPHCQGGRLNEQALSVRIEDKNIHELSALTVAQTAQWFAQHSEINELLNWTWKQIESAINCLTELGLEHLDVNRAAASLSGGEGQRIRLAQQINTPLSGVTYVLDEPSAGLHPHDIRALNRYLLKLKAKGNTIVLVEHNSDVIAIADVQVELGPGAGPHGGNVVYIGPPQKDQPLDAVPAPALNPVPGGILLKGVNRHTLVNRDFEFIGGVLTAITGPSGSGKSTLIHEVLAPSLLHGHAICCDDYENHLKFDKVLVLDSRMKRLHHLSTVFSEVGAMSFCQQLWGGTPEAISVGLNIKHFSYMTKDGGCSQCHGSGKVVTNLDFLEDIMLDCEHCQGSRYQPQALQVKFRNKTFSDIMSLTLTQYHSFLCELDAVKGLNSHRAVLDRLIKTGLGHLRLGQASDSLSTGERQRLVLILKVPAGSRDSSVILLDEPATGLHDKDVQRLIQLFYEMAESGHSIIFAEHSRALIAAAQQIIRL